MSDLQTITEHFDSVDTMLEGKKVVYVGYQAVHNVRDFSLSEIIPHTNSLMTFYCGLPFDCIVIIVVGHCQIFNFSHKIVPFLDEYI